MKYEVFTNVIISEFIHSGNMSTHLDHVYSVIFDAFSRGRVNTLLEDLIMILPNCEFTEHISKLRHEIGDDEVVLLDAILEAIYDDAIRAGFDRRSLNTILLVQKMVNV